MVIQLVVVEVYCSFSISSSFARSVAGVGAVLHRVHFNNRAASLTAYYSNTVLYIRTVLTTVFIRLRPAAQEDLFASPE